MKNRIDGVSFVRPWVKEGMTETFEHSRVREGIFSLGYNETWVKVMQHKLCEGFLRPMAEYLAIKNREWRSSSVAVECSYYMMAWPMMSFMMVNDKAFKTLRAVITSARLIPWRKAPSLPERFAQNSPEGMKSLDARWRAWIRKLPWTSSSKKRC
ncbi:MAG: hypothetical protein COB33_001320 [Thiotrichaceae bacterium]|nr:hypothetical protein [Thiotrichaceae bacterium]PCI12492.1 MAG: hypothetical protein COB71_08760 [Thiotrichales bacterium]